MEDDLVERLVPPPLWRVVEPRIPRWKAREQGGGTSPRDDRASLAAVVFVLVTGCAWRRLPPVFGVSKATAHRRFTHWTSVGLWKSFTDVAAADLGGEREFEWFRTILHAAALRADAAGRDRPGMKTITSRPRDTTGDSRRR
ncbi:transposase [Saccharothrix xinjiangensis]|uniref:Transposase n=1 Tax=Saccharothrix xinjiangensis TaxID=204798 RepID=A0ABV9Y4T7_9PSEU